MFFFFLWFLRVIVFYVIEYLIKYEIRLLYMVFNYDVWGSIDFFILIKKLIFIFIENINFNKEWCIILLI